MDDAKSYMQKLMDGAYARWQQNDAAAREVFVTGVARYFGCASEDAISRFEEMPPDIRNGLEHDYKLALWTQERFQDQLGPLERIAVLVGNLNYQVGNGGWSQWDFNGYADAAGAEVLRILKRVGTPAALEAADIADEVLKLTGKRELSQEARYRGGYAADDDEDADEAGYAEIERLGLGSRFYEIDDQLIEDVEAAVLREAVAKAWDDGRPMSFEHEGRLVRVVGVTSSVTLGLVLDVTPFEDCGDTHVSQEVTPTLRQLHEAAVSLGLLEEVGVAEPTGFTPAELFVGREYLTPEGHRLRHEGVRQRAAGEAVVPFEFSWVEPKWDGRKRYDRGMVETFRPAE